MSFKLLQTDFQKGWDEKYVGVSGGVGSLQLQYQCVCCREIIDIWQTFTNMDKILKFHTTLTDI